MNNKDVDFTRIKGVAFDVDGVLSPSVIPLHPSGEPLRMVSVKDGYAIQQAVKKGLHLAIISGGTTRAVRVRFEGLGVTDVFMGASMKLPIFERWMASRRLRPDEVAFVGDDIPDLPAMQAAGLAIAPADACAEVLAAAHYITPCTGGHGVARHVLEQVLKAHGHWLDDHHAFGW